MFYVNFIIDTISLLNSLSNVTITMTISHPFIIQTLGIKKILCLVFYKYKYYEIVCKIVGAYSSS